jgi:hypothetical protein
MARHKVNDQLSLNDYRLSLVRLVGPALVALVTLGQFGAGNRFRATGPTWLDPASLSALVASALFFAYYYGNTTYVSAHLRNGLAAPEKDSKHLLGDSDVPSDTAKTSKKVAWGRFQFVMGWAFLVASVGLFLAFLWT